MSLVAWFFAELDFWRARRTVRRDAARRRRAEESATAALCPPTDYQRADADERRALRNLVWLGGAILALVAAVILAGCGGVYPLEPSPDAGADAGLPPCAAPAGYVTIAHGCGCASDPLADDCAVETDAGRDHRALASCVLPNGEHCAASCAECAP